jgi:hypothetical protein
MENRPNVLIIEDDSIQARRLEALVQRFYPSASVDKIATESEFRAKLPDIHESAYAVALVDMMLRWTDPSPNMEPPPPEIIDEGFFIGGLRCRKALLGKKIPSIVFTVHQRDSFPQLQDEGVDFVQKGPTFEPILSRIVRYLGEKSTLPSRPEAQTLPS